MEIRKMLEEAEFEKLSEYAAKSALSKGRNTEEEKCNIRTEFQRDRDRIIHSKAFRRLKDKMQVFIAPEKAHIRTRLLHTLEVSQIARTISRSLSLNEDLTEAIALGHDLGHTPFGHGGEYALNNICSGGFRHNEQSLRVVERLEKNGAGLSLTWEVRDGILNHRTGMSPETLEGMVVQISDKIAYLNHDVEDAVNAGVISLSDIPKQCVTMLGDTGSKRINTMTRAVITASYKKPFVVMDEKIKDIVSQLRDFMFEHVYLADSREGEKEKIMHVVKELYYHFLYTDKTDIELYRKSNNLFTEASETVICDYISGMTDGFAISKYGEVFLPHYRMQ